ncbi:MAG: methyl-accepting chemotaxis protein [Nitrospiraceae bacterium]|nr:MAG: methyl-accepting chemotaxis protein [Nitrospiraceae bacterium]
MLNWHFRLGRKYYFLCVVFISVIAGIILVMVSNAEKKKIIENTKEHLIDEKFNRKKFEVERFFTHIYQSIRTISLLPSVKDIKGGNRTSEEENVVTEKRFSKEGYLTVQQLYNNLASNVNMSEIYCILDGFTKDQVPFLMYDSVILNEVADRSSGSGHAGSDYPEELEDEEYSYYPHQLAYFKSRYPMFAFTKMDDIPAVTSPPMRTCDNTQYTSKSKGNPADAFGILYSVPFYDHDDRFRGIISAIFRLNALEALLLDIPFLVISDMDKAEAGKIGFNMPDKPGNFVLVNKEHDIFIGDRRDEGFISQIRERVKAGSFGDDIYSEDLNIKDNGKWMLLYRFDPVTIKNVVQAEKQKLTLKLAGIVIMSFLIVGWIYSYFKKKDQLMNVALDMKDIAEGEGDLTKRLSGQWDGEIGELVKWVNAFIEKIQKVVINVKSAGDQVASANKRVIAVTDIISEKMIISADRSSQVASASNGMTEAVSDIAKNASDMSLSAHKTLQIAQTGGNVVKASVNEVLRIKTAVSDLAQLINSLNDQSREIGDIISVINDIAEQTNLLALNAAIEAARAGDVGRGFAVVADEVKKLAEKTSRSTDEIRRMINTIQNKTMSAGTAMGESLKMVEAGVSLSNQAGESLQQIVNSVNSLQGLVQTIASATMEMSVTAEQVNKDIDEIADISKNTAATAEEMYVTSFELAQSEHMLASEISFFKTEGNGVAGAGGRGQDSTGGNERSGVTSQG